jgi:hypothetical protein
MANPKGAWLPPDAGTVKRATACEAARGRHSDFSWPELKSLRLGHNHRSFDTLPVFNPPKHDFGGQRSVNLLSFLLRIDLEYFRLVATSARISKLKVNVRLNSDRSA